MAVQVRGRPVTKTIVLPTLHSGQVAAYLARSRFYAVRCGRRWGKTVLGQTEACDTSTKGYPVGVFAPDYKILSETYNEVLDTLQPIVRRASQQKGVIRLTTGGRVDFWSLENERAGRSRKYKFVWIDEGAYTKPNVRGIWEKSIRPTLLDLAGTALVTSNTNGVDPDNFFWSICNDKTLGFTEFHAPTHTNPYLPKEELAKLQAENHPLVYAQEYLAEFVDWSGVQFFEEAKLLEFGQPIAIPNRGDGVYAIIDTAVKDGRAHDGTAVSYWLKVSYGFSYQLVCLDWDIVQIEGSLLEGWLPSVFQRLEELAKETKARHGSLGVWIEDKASGSILLQQAARRNWDAKSIESSLTAVGKDERAISVSGYVHKGLVKVAAPAYHKTTVYKGASRNHFMSQILRFRVGDKNAATRADDLLDTFTYGIAIGLGNSEGH
jgi:phage terminase large subunit-like protein